MAQEGPGEPGERSPGPPGPLGALARPVPEFKFRVLVGLGQYFVWEEEVNSSGLELDHAWPPASRPDVSTSVCASLPFLRGRYVCIYSSVSELKSFHFRRYMMRS